MVSYGELWSIRLRNSSMVNSIHYWLVNGEFMFIVGKNSCPQSYLGLEMTTVGNGLF